MKKMNKKGFTLIELLAVIVILAIVAAVSMTVVVPMFANNPLEAAKPSVSNMRQQIVNACSGMGVEGIDGAESMYGKFNGTVTSGTISDCLKSTCTATFTAAQLQAMNISGELPTATISFDKCQITSGTCTFESEGQFKGIVVSVDTDGKITATKQ